MKSNREHDPRWNLRRFWCVTLGLVAGAGFSVFLFSRIVLEKLATQLFMPIGLIWLGIGGLMLLAFVRHNRLATRSLLLTWLTIYLACNGHLAKLAIRHLERDFVDSAIGNESFDALILLGGGTSVRPNSTPQLSLAGDRVITAIRLYKLGRTRKIICTGSQIAELDRGGVDQSQVAKSLLVDAGIPASKIECIGGRTTSEEMRTLGQMFPATERVGVITSAWHLHRALRLANSQGFYPQPVPSDFRSPPNMNPTVVDLVPSGDAALTMQLFAKECLARLVGR